MPHADELVLDILQNPLSECAWIDYKRKPYSDEKKSDFIKDVIAMLNSTECIGEDKFIILGVDDNKELIGLNGVDFADDNEWQDLADKMGVRTKSGKILISQMLLLKRLKKLLNILGIRSPLKKD